MIGVHPMHHLSHHLDVHSFITKSWSVSGCPHDIIGALAIKTHTQKISSLSLWYYFYSLTLKIESQFTCTTVVINGYCCWHICPVVNSAWHLIQVECYISGTLSHCFWHPQDATVTWHIYLQAQCWSLTISQVIHPTHVIKYSMPRWGERGRGGGGECWLLQVLSMSSQRTYLGH